MAVTNKIESDKLILELDNGDREKLELAFKEWGFKDLQSLLRFVTSILVNSSDNETIAYKDENGELTSVSPADHLLKTNKAD